MSFLGRLRTTGGRSLRSRCRQGWILLPQASPLLWGLQAASPWHSLGFRPIPHFCLHPYPASPVRMSVSRFPRQSLA